METRVRFGVLTAGVLLMWVISFAVSAVLLIPRVDVRIITSNPEQVRLIAALVSLTLFALSSATLLLVRGLTLEHQRASRLERELQKGAAAFEKSRRTLDTLLGHADSTILIFNSFGDVVYVNPAHERILGYSPQEYHDDPQLGDRIVFPEDRQKRADFFSQVAQLDIPAKAATIRYHSRAGNLVCLDYTASPILSSAGVTIGVLLMGHDITERKQAEAALRESEEIYRSLTDDVLESSSVGMFILDADFRVVWVNKALEAFFGLCRDEVLGKDKRKLISERIKNIFEDPEAFTNKVFATYDENTYIESFDCHVLQSGEREERWLHHWSQPIKSGLYAGGRIEHYSDITERKRAQDVLRENERKYRTLVESIPQKIFLKDAKSVYVSCNENYARDLGITPEDIAGKTDYDFYSEELADKYQTDDKRIMESGEMEEIEEEYIYEGQKLYVRTVKTPVRDEDGNTVGVLGIFSDITEHKQLQEQFLHAQKLEAVGRLAGGVAHDFNNLLTVMLGYSEMLLSNLEDDRLKSHAEAISDAAKKAEALTSQLLAFSRKQVREPRILNLNDVVAETEKMLHRMIGEDIELVVVLDSNLGSVQIDPGQIEQMIMNLVVNARDAMPDGGKLVIETANVELDAEYANAHLSVQPGDYVMLAVTDTGLGMDKETQKRVFEPFFTTKEAGSGTGLGLSTVYGIVKQNNGNVWVYSEPGKGTTFKVYLPVVRKETPSTRVTKAKPEIRGGSETILLVEDEEVVRELAQKVLEQKGYKVLTARHGAEAIIVSEQYDGPIHLLLTDVIMPEMSGKELAERLLALHSDLRVTYMSGYADAAIFQNGRVPDAASYLQKPFTPDGLLRKVRSVLDGVD